MAKDTPPPTDDLLDLPLAEGEPPETPPATPGLRRPEGPPRSRPRGPEPAGRPPRRWGWWAVGLLALAAAVVIGAITGYLWPRAAPAVARATPTLLDFGDRRLVRAGAESDEGAPLALEIENAGEQPLHLRRIAVAGPGAADFALGTDGCSGKRLGAGESCTLLVRFVPSGRAGRRTASLEVTSNASNSPVSVALVGTAAAVRLAVDRRQIDFGPEPVGETGTGTAVTLSNPGTVPVAVGDVAFTGRDAGDFARLADHCSASTLGPGEECRVEVAFAPQGPGEKTAELAVASDATTAPPPVGLSGVGAAPGPEVALAAPGLAGGRLDFGDQRVGTASPVRTVRLSNPPGEGGTISVGKVHLSEGGAAAGQEAGSTEGTEGSGQAQRAGGFALSEEDCSGASLAAGGGCSIGLTFAPSSEGSSEAYLVIPRQGGEPTWLPLAGRGVVPRLSFAPDRLDFGEARVAGKGTTKELVLSNPGSGSLRVGRIRVTGAGAAAFSTVRDGCSETAVPPAGSCRLEVAFHPLGNGPATAELAVPSDAAGGPSGPARGNVALRGEGLAPVLSLDSSRLDFGRVQETLGQERRLTVANRGRAPLDLRSVTVAGADSGDFQLEAGSCATAVPPESSCTLSVRFDPAGTPGPRKATLLLAHNAGGGRTEVPLAGTALPAPAPEIAFEPASLRFGEEPVGERSGIVTLTLRNRGDARLVFQDPYLDGDAAQDFRLVPGSCDGLSYLAPGSFCTIGFRFAPTAAGERRARLVVRNNAAPGGRSQVALVGRGAAAPGGP